MCIEFSCFLRNLNLQKKLFKKINILNINKCQYNKQFAIVNCHRCLRSRPAKN